LDFCPFGGIKVLGLKTNKKVKKMIKKGGMRQVRAASLRKSSFTG